MAIFTDPCGQILSLCDQMNRQSPVIAPPQISNLPAPTSTGFVTNRAQPYNFNPNFQQIPTGQQQQFGGESNEFVFIKTFNLHYESN